MQTSSADITTNIGLLRQVLIDMGLVVTPTVQHENSAGVNTSALQFRDPAWACVIFTYESKALVRVYASIARIGDASHARVLEAVNFANYNYLTDFTMELDLSRNDIRLRSSYRGQGANLSPGDVKDALSMILTVCRYWACAMPLVLQSTVSVEDAFESARKETLAKNDLPPNSRVPNT